MLNHRISGRNFPVPEWMILLGRLLFLFNETQFQTPPHDDRYPGLRGFSGQREEGRREKKSEGEEGEYYLIKTGSHYRAKWSGHCQTKLEPLINREYRRWLGGLSASSSSIQSLNFKLRNFAMVYKRLCWQPNCWMAWVQANTKSWEQPAVALCSGSAVWT